MTTQTIQSLHCIMVLDESGSMEDVLKETQQSVMKFIANQQKDALENKREMFFTLVKFSSAGKIATVYDRQSIETVDTSKLPYDPCGLTALYQAIGKTIVKYEKETSNVVFVIFTDGQENNSSSLWSRELVFGKIADRKKAGWEFIFLGANQDNFSSDAPLIGVDNAGYFPLCNKGVCHALDSVSRSVSRYAQFGKMDNISRAVSMPTRFSAPN